MRPPQGSRLRQHAVQVFFGLLTGTDARHESRPACGCSPLICLGSKDDRRVEVAEEDDHPHEEQIVHDGTGAEPIWTPRSVPSPPGRSWRWWPGTSRIDEAKIGGMTPAVFIPQRQMGGLPAVHFAARPCAWRIEWGCVALAALHEHDGSQDVPAIRATMSKPAPGRSFRPAPTRLESAG